MGDRSPRLNSDGHLKIGGSSSPLRTSDEACSPHAGIRSDDPVSGGLCDFLAVCSKSGSGDGINLTFNASCQRCEGCSKIGLRSSCREAHREELAPPGASETSMDLRTRSPPFPTPDLASPLALLHQPLRPICPHSNYQRTVFTCNYGEVCCSTCFAFARRSLQVSRVLLRMSSVATYR